MAVSSADQDAAITQVLNGTATARVDQASAVDQGGGGWPSVKGAIRRSIPLSQLLCIGSMLKYGWKWLCRHPETAKHRPAGH